MTPPSDQPSSPTEWFYVRETLAGVWLIDEPQHVGSWLIAGTDSAALLDTGMGVLPIRPVAEACVSPPVRVINTHFHFDHIGGNYEFEDIAIHEIGVPLIEQEVPPEWLEAYLHYADRQLQALSPYTPLDQEFFWLLTAETRPRPFPQTFDRGSWRITPTTATHSLREGDQIDLGGRTLTVLHTPGHSPDGISLLEEREGLLFVGDAFNVGPIYCHFPESDPVQLARTARRLADLSDDVRYVVAHHYSRVLAEPNVLKSYARDAERVRDGDVELVAGRDVLGTAMLEAIFDHYTITLADPGGPEP